MKMVQKLSLLALALFVASCNEQVSPELQSSNATTPDSTTAIPPSEYYFKVTNSSALLLNYKLHKTGTGNTTAACEVKNTSGMSSDIFRGDPTSNDITCYFDAEELSLFNSGMNYTMEASSNTCDFVAHSPFSFYEEIPGNSSDNLTQIVCTNDTTTGTHVADAALARGIDITTSSTPLDCGDWASNSTLIAPGTRVKFAPENDEELCRFNYPVSGNQCDVGEVNVSVLSVTYTPPGEDPVTQPAILKHEIINRTVVCGGTPGNCVRGAYEELETYEPGFTRITEITQTELNKPFSTEYKLPKLIGTYGSTKRYANYRRNIASTGIDYGSADSTAPTYTAYKDAFGISSFGKTFTPSLMDFFAANKMMDGSPLVTTAMIDAHSIPGNMYQAIPMAADPFLGIGTANKINPFYTFYCLDTAFDIKARIRMVVRDWDRVFPSSADNEYISDIFRGSSSRQDNPTYVELPGDEDDLIFFNDLGDWDDRVPMERTPGPYVPAATIWSPLATGAYPFGFFNPALFPTGVY